MLRAGVPGPLAHLVNLGFALMIPAGVGLFFARASAGSGRRPSAALTAAALAFSAGTFLCIALSDLLPELQFHAHDRCKLSAALLAGVGLMAAAVAWEGPEPTAPAAAPAAAERPRRAPRRQAVTVRDPPVESAHDGPVATIAGLIGTATGPTGPATARGPASADRLPRGSTIACVRIALTRSAAAARLGLACGLAARC